MIPLDPIGYAVDLSDGTVHTRYATHAGNAQRTRTEKGVETLLDGAKAKVCAICYPSPRYATLEKAKVPQKRRSGRARKRDSGAIVPESMVDEVVEAARHAGPTLTPE